MIGDWLKGGRGWGMEEWVKGSEGMGEGRLGIGELGQCGDG